ncbi:glutamate racemase [Candidatus Gottesmanbacteria bacterium]|nr:glutamate racemase [Candidatus Gottesmanbacteria bacterium]
MRLDARQQADAPIGILDSGLGGLTIWREIRDQLPDESTIYIGDHAYQPYGGRSVGVIRRRVTHLITFLLRQRAKIIVVACNTATVAGIDVYRRWFPGTPIIGVVPVVKTAVSLTKTKHVAMLSTPFTAASSYQKRLIKTFAHGCTVENIGIPDLASLIEEGALVGRMERLLRQFLNPKKMNRVDVIALGCTHYPFIRDKIGEIIGKGVSIIDSGGAVARHTARILDANTLRVNGKKRYTIFYTTGDAVKVSRIARRLMGENIQFVHEHERNARV